jgi:hypothetical protein
MSSTHSTGCDVRVGEDVGGGVDRPDRHCPTEGFDNFLGGRLDVSGVHQSIVRNS